MSAKLDLTKEQRVMMALFIDNSDDSSITLGDFGQYVGCRTTRLIRYMNDIDVLEKREMVRCCRDRRGISYRVPMEVIESFQHDEKYVPADCSGLTCHQLFGMIEEIFDMRYAATVRFRDRCRLNINITMGRKEDAPLFPNGKPDKLTFESERKKRNAGISASLSGLMSKG